MSRKISDQGIALLKILEGDAKNPGKPVLESYPDGGGVWTIGYGTTKGVHSGMKITPRMADNMMKSDLEAFEETISGKVSVILNPHQYDALVLFCYNIGCGGFGSSTLLRLLNGGDYSCVPEQIARWNKINGEPSAGLDNRRKAESLLWSGSFDDLNKHLQEWKGTKVKFA